MWPEECDQHILYAGPSSRFTTSGRVPDQAAIDLSVALLLRILPKARTIATDKTAYRNPVPSPSNPSNLVRE